MEEPHLVSLMLGALVGVILGLTGAGGAIIAVPLLVFGLHLVVADAAPIALLAVSLSAASGALIAWRAGTVRYRAAGLVALTGVLTAPAGLLIAQRISNDWLIVVFALVMAYVAFRM